MRKLQSTKSQKTGRDPHPTDSKIAAKARGKVQQNQVRKAIWISPSGSKGQIPSVPGWHPAAGPMAPCSPNTFLLLSGNPVLMLPEHTGPKQRLKTGLGAPVAPNSIADAHRNKAKQRKATSSPAHMLTCRLEVCTNTEITRAGAMLMHACYCRQGSYLRVPPCVTAPLHSTAGTTAACCHPSYLLLCLDKQSWDEPASEWKK